MSGPKTATTLSENPLTTVAIWVNPGAADLAQRLGERTVGQQRQMPRQVGAIPAYPHPCERVLLPGGGL
jgi:hypothetical protein